MVPVVSDRVGAGVGFGDEVTVSVPNDVEPDSPLPPWQNEFELPSSQPSGSEPLLVPNDSDPEILLPVSRNEFELPSLTPFESCLYCVAFQSTKVLHSSGHSSFTAGVFGIVHQLTHALALESCSRTLANAAAVFYATFVVYGGDGPVRCGAGNVLRPRRVSKPR